MSNLNREAVWDKSCLMLALDTKSRFSVRNKKSELFPVPQKTLLVTGGDIKKKTYIGVVFHFDSFLLG